MSLKTSARNQFSGAVLQVSKGSVNDEIVVVLDGSGTRVVAIVTSTSTRSLGLEPGRKVIAMFKASWVVLMEDTKGIKFSSRNQLHGTVVSVKEGTLNTEVRIRLDGGEVITAAVTAESAKQMGLEAGFRIVAMIKASHVIIGAMEE